MERVLQQVNPIFLLIFLCLIGANEALKLPINYLKLKEYLRKNKENKEIKARDTKEEIKK